MRIVFYSGQVSGHGGTETVLKGMCQGLQQRGHKVQILLTAPSTDSSWEKGLPVKYVAVPPSYVGFAKVDPLMAHVLFFQHAMRGGPAPDIIVCLGTWQTAVARAVAESFSKRPKVISWMQFSLHVMPDSKWLNFADMNIAISAGIQAQLATAFPEVPTPLVYHPVVDQMRFIPRPDITTFVYVGRLMNQQKRIDTLFTALSEVDGDWRLKIIGDGPDEVRLKQQAHDQGIEDKVEWLGWQSDPWSAIDEATALVLPSDFEGFGLVLVEALSCGIPVIASDCHMGPSDIVRPGTNGWLYPPRDIASLRGLIQGIIHGALELPSPESCQETAKRFSYEDQVDNFERVLKTCPLRN